METELLPEKLGIATEILLTYHLHVFELFSMSGKENTVPNCRVLAVMDRCSKIQ